MYGGVATPLALLHGDNARTKHISVPNRPNPREDSFRNVMRLPPLRETNHRDHGLGNCENEPLLPGAIPRFNNSRNGAGKSQEDHNQPPPLPPHKGGAFPVNNNNNMVSTINVPYTR